MSAKMRFLAVLALPFFLVGCGEGYELIKVDNYFPYGNKRTAGSGYAYVLAKMLPEKELMTKPVEREWKPEVIEMLPKEDEMPEVKPEPEAKAADEIFLKDGKK